MKLCLFALALAVFIGSTSAINEVNCNLRTGAGCSPSSPHFRLQFRGFSPSGTCRRSYQMRVRLFGSAKGFYCYFLTNSPTYGRYTYTISHNAAGHSSSNSPWIRVQGSNGKIQPASSGISPYNNNFWEYKDLHARRGESWVYYKFTRKKLFYYSTNLEHTVSLGHPNLFDPVPRDTYIGLNRAYETSSNRGGGLCQVYCEVIRSFSAAGRRGAAASAVSGSRFSSGSSRPRDPPAAP